MRSLKVKSASENHVVIGFVDPNADRHACEQPAGATVRDLAEGSESAERSGPCGSEAVARGSGREGCVGLEKTDKTISVALLWLLVLWAAREMAAGPSIVEAERLLNSRMVERI